MTFIRVFLKLFRKSYHEKNIIHSSCNYHCSGINRWENYPENNPRGLIKNWLTKFLDETKDFDFSAQTSLDQNNKEVFVKQEYERNSYLWKLCYRTGKEATDAGRKFAQKWLSEL